MSEFQVGREYRLQEIRAILGGGMQTYLPQRGGGGPILYGLFNLNLNPDAPDEVQVGDLPNVMRNAEKLASQADEPIPIFVRDRKGKPWVYRGLYRFAELVDDPEAI